MRRLAGALGLAMALAGCATWPFGPAAGLLADADRLAREGDAPGAVTKYDEYLAQYPDAPGAARARESRATLTATLAARAEAARLGQEAARLGQEVTRLREELARREADLTRVRQEAERLRRDLERLKQADLRLERTR